MRVAWSPAALLHLRDIHAYISADNPAAADQMVQTINQKVGRLAQTPRAGRPGRVAGTREVVVRPFVVAYAVSDKLIVILAVIHGARRWPRRFIVDA